MKEKRSQAFYENFVRSFQASYSRQQVADQTSLRVKRVGDMAHWMRRNGVELKIKGKLRGKKSKVNWERLRKLALEAR